LAASGDEGWEIVRIGETAQILKMLKRFNTDMFACSEPYSEERIIKEWMETF
jgi:hypothetical protein